MKLLLTTLATVGMMSAASAVTNLVTNGDFTSGGDSWGTNGVGTAFEFTTTAGAGGGNPGGFAKIDQTGGGWGGVLINDNDTAVPLGSLGLTAGQTYTFTLDMINLGTTAPMAGMKVEGWAGGAILPGGVPDSNSGDVVFAVSNAWDTYTFDYTIGATADAIKFVPLMVGQAQDSSVGFDNVGVVVPEPTSALLIGMGGLGLLFRRRI